MWSILWLWFRFCIFINVQHNKSGSAVFNEVVGGIVVAIVVSIVDVACVVGVVIDQDVVNVDQDVENVVSFFAVVGASIVVGSAAISILVVVLGIANKNVTVLSSTHCSAPSAWPFRGNIIGFSQFWRKLVIFCTWNIYEIEQPSINEYLRFLTIILWHLLHRLVLFFWHYLCFRRFNRCYLWFFKLFYFFLFLIYFTVTCIYNVGWFIVLPAFYWLLFNKRLCVSAGGTW